MLDSNAWLRFMNNYFTSFRLFLLLTDLGINNILARDMFNKNGLRKCTIIGNKQLQKRNVTSLNSAADAKQKCCVTCVAGQNDRRALYIASSESCWPNINIFGVGTKLKESILKSNNQIISTVQPEHSK